MVYSFTAVSELIDLLTIASAYWFIRSRLKSSGNSSTASITYLKKFFLFFGIFMVFMNAPHIFLYTRQDLFSPAMAIGYTIGHIFLYVSMIYIARMTFTIVPSLVKYEKYAIYTGIVLAAIVTFLETKLMVFGPHKPFLDVERHITNLNVPSVIGGAIALSFSIAVLPPTILFFISAFKTNGAKRIRSLLLALGLLTLVLAGPLHDNARSWQVFLAADIATAIANTMLAVGIAYKLEQSLSAKVQAAPVQTPSV